MRSSVAARTRLNPVLAPGHQRLPQHGPVAPRAQSPGHRFAQPLAWTGAGGGEELLDAQVVDGADRGPGVDLGTEAQRDARILVRPVQFGRAVGVATPVIDVVVQISNVVHDRDWWGEGRSAEQLGLTGMSLDQIRTYLRTGKPG
jgi:hypothetical protein